MAQARSLARTDDAAVPQPLAPDLELRLDQDHQRRRRPSSACARTPRTTCSEMKLRSATTRSAGPPRSLRGARRGRSPRTARSTRGSCASSGTSWPCPTSRATTCSAPWCSSTWVKPPVEAPTSRQRRPCTASPCGPNASSARQQLVRRPAHPVSRTAGDGEVLLLGHGHGRLGRDPAVEQHEPGVDQLARLPARTRQTATHQLDVEPAGGTRSLAADVGQASLQGAVHLLPDLDVAVQRLRRQGVEIVQRAVHDGITGGVTTGPGCLVAVEPLVRTRPRACG